LLALKEVVDRNPLVSRSALEDEYFSSMMRYGSAICDWKRRKVPVRAHKTQCYVFFGYPGMGKSTLMKLIARYLATDGRVYFAPNKKGSGQYYDDYDGEEVMVLDEMGGERMRPVDFNCLADEHPCLLPVHGKAGHQFVSKYLLIGTNTLPRHWWANRTEAEIRQTIRRIDGMFVFHRKIPKTFELDWYMTSNVWKRNENGVFVFESRSQRLLRTSEIRNKEEMFF